MLQEDVARFDLAARRRRAQRFQELLAMTGNGALNADYVDTARRRRRSDPHLFRELTPGRAADERIGMPRVEGALRIRRWRRGRVDLCLRSEVLDDHIVPVITFLMPKHDEVLGHGDRLVRD